MDEDLAGVLGDHGADLAGVDGADPAEGEGPEDDYGDGGNVARLRRAMTAEQAAPEVLPFKSELVGAVLAAVAEREEALAEFQRRTFEEVAPHARRYEVAVD